MGQSFHLYVVAMLHIGFALLVLLWRRNGRFSQLFAAAWLIEAARAMTLVPWINSGAYRREWRCLGEVLCFPATALLLMAGGALVGRKVPRWVLASYLVLGIPFVVGCRYFGPAIIQNLCQVSLEDAWFWTILTILTAMFVPVTLMRGVFSIWMFRDWQQQRGIGQFLSCVFAATYAATAIVVPFQFYFSWSPGWWKLVWCLRVFGFSVGLLSVIIARSEKKIRENHAQLKLVMEQLAEAQRLLIGQERLKALGQMAAGVAHDINNSLTPLLTYSHLLAQHPELPQEAKEMTGLIQLSVKDTAATVRRLDHFYRERHDASRLELLDLGDLVEQAVELTKPMWRDQGRAMGKQITVLAKVVSLARIEGDASQLRTALTNLIFNSCAAIAVRGSIVIHVDADDGYAEVELTDDGSGMNQEQLDRCLEPFYSTKVTGSGLGLSECRGIIRQHGGLMSVTSVEGEGTTVSLRLPIHSGVPVPPAAERRYNPLSTAKILVVDDDEPVATATAQLLATTLQADVKYALNAADMLAILEQQSFDLLVLDQGLPDMDGLTALMQVKARWPDLLVIMVSGWSLPRIDDGPRPDSFISKPYVPSDLCDCARAHLDGFVNGINAGVVTH